MELIIFIVVFSWIITKVKKSNKTNSNNASQRTVTYEMPRQATRMESARVQIQKQTYMSAEDVSEKIARTKQRILENRNAKYGENVQFKKADSHRQQENKAAMLQVNASRIETRNTTILERAKANAEEDKVDVTLETMEAEHNHSERVSAAVHHHPEDIIPENVLGNIEDLMIKGYDGNLCFERDFVGEGLDMVSRFVVPSDIPDSSQNNLA